VLDNTIAVLGRLTTVDQLIGEWTPNPTAAQPTTKTATRGTV